MFVRNKWTRLPAGEQICGQHFIDAGYPCVILPSRPPADWEDVDRWCLRMLGRDNHVRVINHFWFLTDDDATKFALTWC